MFNYDNLTVNIEEISITLDVKGNDISINKAVMNNLLRSSNPVVLEWLKDISNKPIYPIKLAETVDTVMNDKTSDYYQDFSIIKDLEIAKDRNELITPGTIYSFDTGVIEDLVIKLTDNVVGLGSHIGYDKGYHEYTLREWYGTDGSISKAIVDYFRSKNIDIYTSDGMEDKTVKEFFNSMKNDLDDLEEKAIISSYGKAIVHLEEVKVE